MSVKAAQLRRELEQNKHRCEAGMFIDNQKITVLAADLERLIIEVEALTPLQQQLSEKEARIARLEYGYDKALWAFGDAQSEKIMAEILNESPRQSLAHIQADAEIEHVRKFVKAYEMQKINAMNGGTVKGVGCFYSEYAQQLRAEGK